MLQVLAVGTNHEVLNYNGEQILVIKNPTENFWDEVELEAFEENAEVRESDLKGIINEKDIYLIYYNDFKDDELRDDEDQIIQEVKRHYNINNSIVFEDETIFNMQIRFLNKQEGLEDIIKNNPSFKNAYNKYADEYKIEVNKEVYILQGFLEG